MFANLRKIVLRVSYYLFNGYIYYPEHLNIYQCLEKGWVSGLRQ